MNAVHRGVTGNVDASGFATIHVFRHNSDYNNNPTPIISGVAKLTIPITFDDSNLTGLNSKYASLSSQARTDLTRGNITFTNQVGGAIKYDTVVDALHPTIYATTFPGMTPRVITYNEAALDDISDSSFVPFEKRHHTRPLADHELCHALFLDHNTAYERSIMWPTSYCYFVWGALTPRDDSDWSTLTGPNGY